MPARKKPANKQAAIDWMSDGSSAELGESETVAHAIITERPDLMPSVKRIMTAELENDDRLRAIQLFEVALSTPGDPNRDPRVAIERIQSGRSGGGAR